jgi:hypothetical protein
MIDMVETLGHMVELYRPIPVLTGFYDFVAAAAVGFNGSDPVRTISFD